jgi:hypothetical protein
MQERRLDSYLRSVALAASAGALLLACGGRNPGGPVETLTVALHGAVGDSSGGELAPSLAAAVDLDQVASLTATLTRIEVLPGAGPREGEDEGADADTAEQTDTADHGGGWIPLDVTETELDLLALPPESQPGVVIAIGDLPAGRYRSVRLFLDGATIRFRTAVRLNAGLTLEPDLPYPVRIPSGDQTGVKTDAEFTVSEEGGTVELVFDEAATLANVTATGNGDVMIAPVLRAHGNGEADFHP